MKVLFNDDAGVLYCVPYPMEREHLANYVRAFVGKGIDIFSWDVGVNGVCWYGSKVTPGIFEGRTDFPHYSVRQIAANVRHLAEIGADPPTVVAEECHRHGMKMLAAFRMGLFIADENELALGGGVYYNRFAEAHPEMTIQRVDLAGYRSAKPGILMDYSYPEVREWMLTPMREMAEDYDVDGIELNFIRGNLLFESDEAAEKAPILTEFVREVRRILDRGAEKRHKDRLLLCVRVPDDLSRCKELGMDVGTWIKEGLVEIVMPSQIHGIDWNAPIEDFAALCEGTDCRLLPTIQPAWTPPSTLPQLRAVVHNWYRQGATGFSTFNFLVPRGETEPVDEVLNWLRELRAPDKVAEGERIYPFYGASLSLGKKEVGVRKTLGIPRCAAAALRESRGGAQLRFQAEEWAWDDVMEVDVDGKVLPQVNIQFMDRQLAGMITGHLPRPQEGDSASFLAYAFECYLPPLDTCKEVGLRLVKRADIARDVQVKEIKVVV